MMRESKHSSTGVTICWTAIDFMKKCAEHLQHYIKCYTYNILLYLTASVMLYTCSMQKGMPLTVTENPCFKAGIYLHGTMVVGSASKYIACCTFPVTYCTERLVHRLSLAALRTASVDRA